MNAAVNISSEPEEPSAVEEPSSSAERGASAERSVLERSVPERTCVGCGASGEPEELMRFVVTPDGQVMADVVGRFKGRGAWVHARPQCLTKACQRGFAKSFRGSVTARVEELGTQIALQSERRIDGLLLAGSRRRYVVSGREPVADVVSRVEVALLAEDAQALAKDSLVYDLGLRGKLLVFGTKDRFGALFNRAEIGIVAVLDRGIADAVVKAVSIARLGALAGCGAGNTQRLAEVR